MGVLVFGKTGQVAQELQRLLPDAHFADRADADLSKPATCGALIDRLRPSAVINAAAYTAVDKAETDAATAQAVNADAPTHMALACARLGIPFLHVSTDYVFDGSGDQPRAEDAPTAPLSVYGETKLAGEDGIAAADGQWVVLRTSWVFSSHGANFVKTMLRLAQTRDQLSVVDDQIGGPTPAAAIAGALVTILDRMRDDPDVCGVYHFSGAPDVSWAEFAAEIFGQADLPVRVAPIPTTDYPTPAARPANSRLDCTAIARDFGIARPDWRHGLTTVLQELAP